MFCPNCGKELSDSASFCHICGTKVSKDKPVENAAQNVQEAAEGAGPTETVSEGDGFSQDAAESPAFPENTGEIPAFPEAVSESPVPAEQPKSGMAGWKIALLAIGITLSAFALVGVLAYFVIRPLVLEKTGKASGNNTSVEEEAEEEGTPVEEASEEEAAPAEESSDEGANDLQSQKESVENEVYTGEQEAIQLQVRQVDNSNFPEVTLYVNILDQAGNYVDSITDSDLEVKEITYDGSLVSVSVDEVYRLLGEERANLNLVLDQSASMYGNKMTKAKKAANSFVDQISLDQGDQVEVISFDDYVYMQQEFTNQSGRLHSAIDGIYTYGNTALLDALYVALYQTYPQTGAKCVIGFTDGEENASNFTYDDVVNLSRNTGIPVFIIGIEDDWDYSMLQSLAADCSGRYYSASESNLESVLEDIYLSIYQEQQNCYVIKYRTSNTDQEKEFREVMLEMSERSRFEGSCRKQYIPMADITGAFSDTYAYRDFMIEDSGIREVTAADLQGMSLAQLRIARNEIYARHGRLFKDPLLNQWFYSKNWYLDIDPKYAPSDFDAIRPTPLSKIEQKNATFILEYEKDKMAYEDIFPNASTIALSEYDLALSKQVLQTALKQMEHYTNTATLEENKQKVKDAINTADIRY